MIEQFIEKAFLRPQNKYLRKHLPEIIEAISKQKDKLIIDCYGISLSDVSKKIDDPTYLTDEYLQYVDDGIKILSPTQEFTEMIKDYIPRTIQDLTIPSEFIKDVSFLQQFPNLETLTISDYSTLSLEDLDYIREHTNIKRINVNSSSTFDKIKCQKGCSVIESSHKIADYNGIIINHRSKWGSWSKSLSAYVDQYDDMSRLKRIYNEIAQEVGSVERISISSKPIGINSDITIKISPNGGIDYVGFQHITPKEIAKAFQNITQYAPIKDTVYICENKTYEDINFLKPLDKKSNFKIGYSDTPPEATLEEFKNMRATIDYYKELIESANLSPVEKITSVYDILKTMKYQENEENKSRSRQIHGIVTDGNIVCVGYSAFATQLLKEMGIRIINVGVSVKEADDTYVGHQRNILRVDDDKYNIHGLYAMDITWDSDRDVSIIEENGQRVVTSRPSEEDKEKIVDTYDNLVLYRHFLIPMSDYETRYKDERNPTIYEEYKEGNARRLVQESRAKRDEGRADIENYLAFQQHQTLFDPEEGALTVEKYFNAPKPDLETFKSIITQVRLNQGYEMETAQEDVERTIELHQMLHEQSAASTNLFFKPSQTK